MRHAHYTYITVTTLVVSLVVSGWAPVVFADTATSSAFTTRNTSINSFGGSATSSSFSSVQSGDQTAGGSSTSTSFTVDSGVLYYDTFTPKQQNWRWYDDETSETPTSAFAGENVAPSSIASLDALKLRVSVAEAAGIGEDNIKFKLQFATSSDFSTGTHDVVEMGDCTGSSGWCYADGAGFDNATITTKVLSDADACTASLGSGCGTHNESGTTTSQMLHQASATAEYEFTVVESGATPNTVYFFRLVDTASGLGIPLNTGKNYPSLSTEGTQLTFTIGGIPASTVVNPTVTTAVDTTSTDISFGALPISSAQTAAQRLTISTNASQGYEVFAYTQQDLLGSTDAQIPPVTSTNQSPLDWTTACDPALSGCYGYHTSDAVLSGGSTRFAADDTYAQFSTTTVSEVSYSSGAVTNKTTDIVYKVEVRDSQVADNYSTNVVYIVVPTF